MLRILKPIITLSLILVFQIAVAQPPDPGGDPDIPIDAGIGILIAAGAILGVKKIFDNARSKNHNLGNE